MANIKDIAKLANVSVSTVSRVLNNHSYVSEEKRKVIMEAIDRLDYSRNMNAVQLLKGKTNVIAVMLPFINHPYFTRLVEGISVEALKVNYQLMLCQTNYNTEAEMKVLEMLKMKQIDGMIICSKHIDLNQIEAYTRYGPIVACQDVGQSRVSSVFSDHYKSFQCGIRYLINKGHRYIGLCLARNQGDNSQMRRKAYTDELASIGEPIRDEWIFHQTYRIEDGVEVLRNLLELNSRPTAMMVTSDQAAAGIIMEARKNNIRVPEDLAIIGFDNQPIAEVFDLTTIENQLPEMGAIAFQIGYDQITRKKEQPENRELEYRLIERATV
ncbi:LacI family DNA-binding transcriptional regulator [Paenibacillus alkaliterrae]|uniref:LacI family DNA-binding transcriptional regulator n=1 Tax=Paenibacillus alkaliterrae TaxID=320909 RepID=UPI001F3866EB|nr:LacI family DNA-binding transcriptional regulator [Paenibacillus alkaliterrae]MCF2941791.1 LacI family DNA-binding transcriptional regulator [Paenibacillus alkaliterrae]